MPVKLLVEELPVVLNEVVEDRVSISLPYFRAELLTLDYRDGRVVSLRGPDELRALGSIARQLGVSPEPVSEHLFWDAMQSAGVLLPPNMGELVSFMERAVSLEEEGPRVAVLAVDTNVLYDCTLTHAALLTRARPPVYVSHCVLWEVARASQARLREREVKSVRRLAVERGYPAGALYLASSLARRRALAALREYKRIKKTYPTAKMSPRGCRGDLEIAEDYSRLYARGVNVRLVTHDKEMYSVASSLHLDVLLLEPPPRDLRQVPLHRLSEVVYYLAVNFNEVAVSGEKGRVTLASSWRGMSDSEAQRGTLLLKASEEIEVRVAETIEKARRVLASIRGE